MEKTVKIGGKSVRLSNNVSWMMIYRDQFGRDIIPTLMPMIAGALDVVAGLITEVGEDGELTLENVAKIADGDALINALIHIGGAEMVDFINITWSMAKVCDDDLPDPIEWVKGFDDFPIDKLAPEVFGLAFKGVVSSKNLKRLKDLKRKIQPLANRLISTPLSSPDLSEG